MKRLFAIEWPDDHGPLWMNRDNLLLCLTANCPNTQFTVQDITNDGNCDPTPESAGPECRHVYREAPNGNLRTYFNGTNAYHLCELCGHKERC